MSQRRKLKLGSLFTGYGGLDKAVEALFGAVTTWVSDIEQFDKKGTKIGNAPAILAHRFPGVPNLGDITKVDWYKVPHVDIFAGGSPCQDVSASGHMAGMTEGTRSNLWVQMREGIRIVEPALVCWENVRGALSAKATSALESGEGLLDVAHRTGDPVLRAAGRVLGDLAELGFDAEWVLLSAAAVGAPHLRPRIFVLGAHPDRVRRLGLRGLCESVAAELGRGRLVDVGGEVGAFLNTPLATRGSSSSYDREKLMPTATASRAGSNQSPSPGAAVRPSLSELVRTLPTPTAMDSKSSGGSSPIDVTLTDAVVRQDLGRRRNERHLPTPDASAHKYRLTGDGQQARGLAAMAVRGELEVDPVLPTPMARDYKNAGSRERYDARKGQHAQPLVEVVMHELQPALLPTPTAADGERTSDAYPRGNPTLSGAVENRWGEYTPVIERWERVTRPAPPPTILGKRGNRKLSPAFDEWLMGTPEGWVSEVPGLTDNQKLHACGNGVVPLQAFMAYSVCFARMLDLFEEE